MERKQEHLIEALNQVEQFLETNGEAMTQVITSAARENFSASRERLVQHMKAQDGFARDTRSSVAIKRTLRDQLLEDHIRPIGVVARAELRHVQALAGLTVPSGKARFGSLVAAGYGMAQSARPYEATFLAAGLPADFIAQLVRATDALQEALTTRGEARALRVEATVGLAEESRVARNALRVLDVLVRRAIKDPVRRARWANVSRVATAAIAPREPDQTTGSESTDTIRTNALPGDEPAGVPVAA